LQCQLGAGDAEKLQFGRLLGARVNLCNRRQEAAAAHRQRPMGKLAPASRASHGGLAGRPLSRPIDAQTGAGYASWPGAASFSILLFEWLAWLLSRSIGAIVTFNTLLRPPWRN